MSEWQPIETAPYETSVLIAWKPGASHPHELCVATKMRYGSVSYWFVDGVSGRDAENEFEQKDVIYWMPLPKGPTA